RPGLRTEQLPLPSSRSYATARPPTGRPCGTTTHTVRNPRLSRAGTPLLTFTARKAEETGRSLCLDRRRHPVEAIERPADIHKLAHENGDISLRVPRSLAVTEPEHQVHEVRRLVALEGGHELLVVDPERVGRVVLDPRELVAADPDVLVHRPLAVALVERVPG